MLRLVWACCLLRLLFDSALGEVISDADPLRLPKPGDHQLRVLSPGLLELTRISGRDKPTSPAGPWSFAARQAPEDTEFTVLADGVRQSIRNIGFRQRVIYAPFKQRDLRVGQHLYLELKEPLRVGAKVIVQNPAGRLWPAGMRFEGVLDPKRFSPVIHINQTGYSPRYPRVAMVGYYLGSLGEMSAERIGGGLQFRLLDFGSGKEVFSGTLSPRPDRGFPWPQYQQVWQADFSRYTNTGRFQLAVEGLGTSYPFWIREEVPGAFARTFALGIYHQRCGAENSLPHTRFTHGPCHTRPVDVPNMSYEAVNFVLNQESSNQRDRAPDQGPQLKNVSASLYPFQNSGPLRLAGGHHDAGDYSKYTANSAAFIHILLTAVDSFTDVRHLDNLGLPESGDGKSDVLQLARWEADFLARLQDKDGGFYFLVYPRDRRYEDNVLPDAGDPQVVFPKTTAATAAAVAALAQAASSPVMKAQFPEAAAQYLERAIAGWNFLERAIDRFGFTGSYQKITHYGDEFTHDDELAWAACELFLATGEGKYHDRVREWLEPEDASTRKWGWLRLYEAYGCAIRSYALAPIAGKVVANRLDPRLLKACEDELIATAEEQALRAEQSAYGSSLPVETKRAGSPGWYFSTDAAFDLAVASQLAFPARRDPRPRWLGALISNLNYEQGCNPVNVCYLTGLGWKRQREIVHQFAQNDARVLPPGGIPLGNIQAGFGWLERYQREPGELSFPPDKAATSAYPFYDRWSDAFNLTQEFVILNQARGLAYTSWLMAQTSLRGQPWKASQAKITRAGDQFTLTAEGLDLNEALVVWEAAGQEPRFSANARFNARPAWVEAEAVLPDGRRVFAFSTSSQKE